MLRIPKLVIGIGCVLLSGTLVLGDEPDQLPPDGWWVRYFCKNKQVRDDRTDESTERITLSFVGTEVLDGNSHRWLEILRDMDDAKDVNGPKHLHVSKYLVASKDLLQGDDLRDRAKRGWSRLDDLEAKPLSERNLSIGDHLYFVQAWKQSEPVEQPRVVDYQHGRLTIPIARRLVINTETTSEVAKGRIHSILQSSVRLAWFDPKVSPVYCAARIESQLKRDDKLVHTRTSDIAIEDSGLDAKSKLPDNN